MAEPQPTSNETETQGEIKYRCYSCGQHIVVPAEAVGESVPCPSCNAEMRIVENGAVWDKPQEPIQKAETPRKETKEDLNWRSKPPVIVTEGDKVRARAKELQMLAIILIAIGVLIVGGSIVESIADWDPERHTSWTPTVIGAGIVSTGFWLTLLAQVMHIRAEVMRK